MLLCRQLLKKQRIIHYFSSQQQVQKSLWEKWIPFRGKQKEISPSIDYSRMVDEFLNACSINEDLRRNLMNIMNEIKRVVEEAYDYPITDQILASVSSEDLCISAVEQFIGSMTSPKNNAIKTKFLVQAKINSKTDKESRLVDYYTFYLQKLEALQQGKEQEFQLANEQLLKLAQEGCVEAKHLMAKEMYKVALNMVSGKQKKQKDIMIKEALQMFRENVDENFSHSFFYIGEMSEKGDIPGGVNLVFALECYTIAASFDNPLAFFKLSQLQKYIYLSYTSYKEGVVNNKDPSLEYFYMKKSAELGLKDAMHNLAVMYKEGKIVQLDEMKSLAWFTHSGNLGYVPAMYNTAMIFYHGTLDGTVRPNKKAALIWFEKVQKEGEGQVDVQTEIQQISFELEQGNV